MESNESTGAKTPARQERTASETTTPSPEYPADLRPSTVAVLEHLDALDVGERAYVKSNQLVDELDHSVQAIGQALGVIASQDLATSVTVSKWGHSAGRTTWLVEPRGDGLSDAPLVADGGRVTGDESGDDGPRIAAGVNTHRQVELTIVGDPSHSINLEYPDARQLYDALGGALKEVGGSQDADYTEPITDGGRLGGDE